MLYVGLLHWPCIDKNGLEIATAITNLDLHDCARVCLTYGIDTLYIVHPYQAQLDFAQKIMDHWLEGFGGEYNPIRKRAFEVIRLVKDIEEIRRQTGARMIGTSAAKTDDSMSWADVRSLTRDTDICVLFGTGWGIAPRLIKTLDGVIDPIEGAGDFNHLSVRSAVSIAIDRIVGR
ncbi:MAG: RNA methyltransferase [Deltaproteobacteria bacterium]|nr:RNA methyltransferase [Deltaproteobacteria bacterium]